MSTNDQSDDLFDILEEIHDGNCSNIAHSPRCKRVEHAILAHDAARDAANKTALLAAVGEDDHLDREYSSNALRAELRAAIEHLYGAKS